MSISFCPKNGHRGLKSLKDVCFRDEAKSEVFKVRPSRVFNFFLLDSPDTVIIRKDSE